MCHTYRHFFAVTIRIFVICAAVTTIPDIDAAVTTNPDICYNQPLNVVGCKEISKALQLNFL